MTAREHELERLLREYGKTHTERWQDWNGGNTGECPCSVCAEVRALLASGASSGASNPAQGTATTAGMEPEPSKPGGSSGGPAPEERRFTIEDIHKAFLSLNDCAGMYRVEDFWDSFRDALKSPTGGGR